MIDILIFPVPVGADCFSGFFIGDGQSDFHYCSVLFFYGQTYFIITGKSFVIICQNRSLIAQFKLVPVKKFIDLFLEGSVDSVFEERECLLALRRDCEISAVMFGVGQYETNSVIARCRFMKLT